MGALRKSEEPLSHQIPSQFKVKQPFLIEDDMKVTTKEETLNPVPKIPSKKPKGWGQRHTLAVLGLWGFAMSYAMRFNLTIAIVAMARSRPQPNPVDFGFDRNDTQELSCDTDSISETHHTAPEEYGHGEFDWSAGDQGLILGSFFWGYILTQLPGGFISTRFGGKWPLSIGLLISGVFTILTPLAARVNIAMLIYVRIVQGLAQGMIFPAMQQILASWSPTEERSRLTSIVYSGAQFGTAITMISSGYLIESQWGWPSIFYIIGVLTLVWFGFWAVLVHGRPSEHPWISEDERNYIIESIGEQSSKELMPTPWKEIFRSKPVWAIVIAQVGHSWGFYTLLIELPTYLKTVLHFDMKQNSLISAMPPFFMWISTNIITYIADYCITKKYARTITVRKTSQAIADLGSALALIGASLIICNRTAVVVLLTIAVCMSGGICASYFPNQVEIACNHVGIIMGITNTVANFAGFGTALVAGYLTNDHSNKGNWNSVFFIAAGLYVADVIVYVLFASSKEQSWNRKRDTGTECPASPLPNLEVKPVESQIINP